MQIVCDRVASLGKFNNKILVFLLEFSWKHGDKIYLFHGIWYVVIILLELLQHDNHVAHFDVWILIYFKFDMFGGSQVNEIANLGIMYYWDDHYGEMKISNFKTFSSNCCKRQLLV